MFVLMMVKSIEMEKYGMTEDASHVCAMLMRAGQSAQIEDWIVLCSAKMVKKQCLLRTTLAVRKHAVSLECMLATCEYSSHGRVVIRAFASAAIDSGLILSGVKPMTSKLIIHSFPA